MGAKKKVGKSELHTFLGILISEYDVHVDAAINYEILDKRYWSPDTKVFNFDSYIDVVGEATYPEERAGEGYKLTIYGGGRRADELSATLDDYHVRDDDGHRKWRRVRGKDVPEYAAPRGIGYLDRDRATKSFSGAVWVEHHTVTDMLTLLLHIRPLYLSLHEIKIGRRRVIQSLTLQTSDPSEE